MASATAINSRDTSARRGDDIKLEYGQPEVIAFKFVTGKNVEGRYGPRVLFTTTGEDKLWLDAEDGSDLERGIRDLGVRPGDAVRVTKIKGVHGGGHAIRVELAEETRLESDLRQSIANAETAKRVTAQRAQTATAAPVQDRAAASTPSQKKELAGAEAANTHANDPTISPASAKLCSSFMAAIDAVTEAQAYADRRGLKITFTSEDVRSTAISCYITACRETGRAA